MKKGVNTFHLVAFLLAIAVGMGLVSCGKAGERQPEQSVGSDTSWESSDAPREDSSAPPVTVPPAEAVVSLTCLDVQGEILCIRPAGENRAALVCGVPVNELNEGSYSHVRLYVIDIAEDSIVFESEYDAGEQLLCVRKNGAFVTLDYMDEAVHVYGPDMQLAHSFTAPEGIIQADVEDDCLYSISDHEIRRIDFDGAGESAITFPFDVDVFSYDSGQGRVITSVTLANDTDFFGTAVYSEAAGRFVYSGPFANYSFAGEKLVSMDSDDRYDDEGSLVDSVNTLTVCDLPGGSDPVSFRLPDGVDCTFFSGTEYCISSVFTCDDENPASSVSISSRFYILNAARGDMSAPIAELEGASFIVPEYLEDCGSIIVGACFLSDEGSHSRLVLIHPEAVEMAETLERYAGSAADPELHPLSQELLHQRESADAIEQDFGVRILLGDECLDAAPSGSYSIVSTEDTGDSSNSAGELTEALNTLRRSLDYYPEGFFDAFKNYAGEGGVRFLIVRDMVNENGGTAGGLHYQYGAWYNVVLDIDALMTVHHELWHAVEQRITNEFDEAFSDLSWSEFNPANFLYCFDFDNYYENESMLEYVIPWDNDRTKSDTVYFDQIYSTVTPYEDRATLVEDLLNEYYDPDVYGFADPMERICAFPHLKEKLEYMAVQTERAFGSVYWEEVLQNIMNSK